MFLSPLNEGSIQAVMNCREVRIYKCFVNVNCIFYILIKTVGVMNVG